MINAVILDWFHLMFRRGYEEPHCVSYRCSKLHLFAIKLTSHCARPDWPRSCGFDVWFCFLNSFMIAQLFHQLHFCTIICYGMKAIKLNDLIFFPFLLPFVSCFRFLFSSLFSEDLFWVVFSCAALVNSLVSVHFSCLLTRPTTSCRLHTEVPSTRCLREELVWLQQSLSKLGSPVVLCHNDLLCKNIIYNQGAGEYKLQRCSR